MLANLYMQAEPVKREHTDPARVSHHSHRIGYHFRCEIVEEACETLGYVPYEDTYITTADLAQKQRNNVIMQAFARQGLTYNYDRVKGNEETPDQVRAAIKELFPKIPQNDLEQVIIHAWDKNAGRVGLAKDIALPTRVQYAVIARIRHKYTDYDRLLNAKLFDYHTIRKEVEPVCLKKLIEWRGETDGDDEALEEIVREIIVIDDDDDDALFAGSGDDSSDTGNASDTSLEISHRPVKAEDLKAEEDYERDHRFFQRQMPNRMQAQRTNLARQMIQTHRSQQHNARAYAHNQPATYQHPPALPVQRTYGASLATAEYPRQIIQDGQVFHLVSCPSLSWKSDRLIPNCNRLVTPSHTLTRRARICNTIDPYSQLSMTTMHTYHHRLQGHHRRHPHRRHHRHHLHLRQPGTLCALRHKLHVRHNHTITALASPKTSLGMLSLCMNFHLINTTEDKLSPKRNMSGMALPSHHRRAACTMSDVQLSLR